MQQIGFIRLKPNFIDRPGCDGYIPIYGDRALAHCVKTGAFKGEGKLFVQTMLFNEKGEQYPNMAAGMELCLLAPEDIRDEQGPQNPSPIPQASGNIGGLRPGAWLPSS